MVFMFSFLLISSERREGREHRRTASEPVVTCACWVHSRSQSVRRVRRCRAKDVWRVGNRLVNILSSVSIEASMCVTSLPKGRTILIYTNWAQTVTIPVSSYKVSLGTCRLPPEGCPLLGGALHAEGIRHLQTKAFSSALEHHSPFPTATCPLELRSFLLLHGYHVWLLGFFLESCFWEENGDNTNVDKDILVP